MGEYRCPLKTRISPAIHDEWHPDWQSSVCPILRDEIEMAARNEDYEMLYGLLKMGAEVGQIHLPSDDQLFALIDEAEEP